MLLLVLGVYLLLMSGHTYSPDEETMLEVSRQLVTHGTWAIPSSRSMVEVTGADGRHYSQYGPGQSFAAVPWVATGLLVGGMFPKDQAGYPLRLILASYNALVGAGICALLAAVGLLLGYGRRASVWLGVALAFCTFLWPHSRTFFSEPLTALLLLGSFYMMVRYRYSTSQQGIVGDEKERVVVSGDAPHPGKRVPLRSLLLMALSGVLFALALATKVQYVVALPAFGLYLLRPFARRATKSATERLDNIRPEPQPLANPGRLSGILLWGAGFVLGLLPLLMYNWAVFGNPLVTGYGTDLRATFKTPLGEGVYGLLLSPGKGLVWFALPVLLAAWGLRRFSRRFPCEALFILALGVCIVALFALYAFWHGDGSWGPRYLIPLLPFVLLPALPILEDATRFGGEGSWVEGQSNMLLSPASSLRFRSASLVVAVVLALGFFVNLLGVLVNFDTYINLGYDDQARHFDPPASPIVGHFNLLGQRLRVDSLGFNKPTGKLVFQGGFSYSEGDKTKGELLPRWTTGRGTIQFWPDLSPGPVLVTLRLSDHRPPSLPRALLTLLVNDSPVTPQAQPVPDMPITTDYTFPLNTQPATVAIQSDTWNPSKVGEGERNEEIGLKLESITVSEGGQPRSYNMSESLPPPPYYPQPRWYYDPGTAHPADLWFSYIAETGMGRKAQVALALPVVLVALACLAFGVLGLRAGSRQ